MEFPLCNFVYYLLMLLSSCEHAFPNTFPSILDKEVSLLEKLGMMNQTCLSFLVCVRVGVCVCVCVCIHV